MQEDGIANDAFSLSLATDSKRQEVKVIPCQHFPVASVRDTVLGRRQYRLPEGRMVEGHQNDGMGEMTAI